MGYEYSCYTIYILTEKKPGCCCEQRNSELPQIKNIHMQNTFARLCILEVSPIVQLYTYV